MDVGRGDLTPPYARNTRLSAINEGGVEPRPYDDFTQKKSAEALFFSKQTHLAGVGHAGEGA